MWHHQRAIRNPSERSTKNRIEGITDRLAHVYSQGIALLQKWDLEEMLKEATELTDQISSLVEENLDLLTSSERTARELRNSMGMYECVIRWIQRNHKHIVQYRALKTDQTNPLPSSLVEDISDRLSSDLREHLKTLVNSLVAFTINVFEIALEKAVRIEELERMVKISYERQNSLASHPFLI